MLKPKKIRIYYEFRKEKDAKDFSNKIDQMIVNGFFGKIPITKWVEEVEK